MTMNPSDGHPPASLGVNYESAVIGVGLPSPTSERVLIYDYQLVCDIVSSLYDLSGKDACEYVRVHFLERYLGISSPVFCLRSGNAECS